MPRLYQHRSGLWLPFRPVEGGSIGPAMTQIVQPAGAGGAGAPTGAQYVTLALHADLTAERRLAEEALPLPPVLQLIDGGANAALNLRPRGWNPREVFFAGQDVGAELGPYDGSMYSFTDFGGGATRSRAFVDNEMEVLRLTTGALTNDGGYDTPGQTFGYDFDIGTLILMRARLVTNTASQRAAFGLTTARDDVPAAAGAHKATFVARTASSANWRVATDDGVTDSEADYSPAVALDTAFHTFFIRRTSTEVRFRIDDNAEMVRTANLPGTALAHFIAWGLRTLSALSREIDVSYYFIWRTGLAR